MSYFRIRLTMEKVEEVEKLGEKLFDSFLSYLFRFFSAVQNTYSHSLFPLFKNTQRPTDANGRFNTKYTYEKSKT